MLREFAVSLTVLSVLLSVLESSLPRGRASEAAGRLFAFILTSAVIDPLIALLEV